MRCLVMLPGKIKPKALSAAQDEYIRRLKGFGVEALEYKDEKIDARAPERAKNAEAERLFKLLKEGDYLVVCDERGKRVSTKQLAEFVQDARRGGGVLSGTRRVVIALGGATGFAESVRQRADAMWSLSSLVMAGGVARVVLLEGLYRAFTIVENHPYHNE